MKRSAVSMLVITSASLSSSLVAQNIDEMVKWTSAERIHYEVVAEYAGVTEILVPESGSAGAYSADVTDRYELGFDWSPTQMTMVSQPVVRNFASKLPKGTPGFTGFQNQPCPAPKIDGFYEHAEVLSAQSGLMGTNTIELSIKRAYPAGQVAYAAEGPCNNWVAAPAKSETMMGSLPVPLGMYFAMPQAAGGTFAVGSDGKTMTYIDEPNGWKYTYTLQIVQ